MLPLVTVFFRNSRLAHQCNPKPLANSKYLHDYSWLFFVGELTFNFSPWIFWMEHIGPLKKGILVWVFLEPIVATLQWYWEKQREWVQARRALVSTCDRNSQTLHGCYCGKCITQCWGKRTKLQKLWPPNMGCLYSFIQEPKPWTLYNHWAQFQNQESAIVTSID